jgi:hypothetical protein
MWARAYRADRIAGVRPTNETFRARFLVESKELSTALLRAASRAVFKAVTAAT